MEKKGEKERGGGRETPVDKDRRSFRVWEFDKGLCNKRVREQQKYQKGKKKKKKKPVVFNETIEKQSVRCKMRAIINETNKK